MCKQAFMCAASLLLGQLFTLSKTLLISCMISLQNVKSLWKLISTVSPHKFPLCSFSGSYFNFRYLLVIMFFNVHKADYLYSNKPILQHLYSSSVRTLCLFKELCRSVSSVWCYWSAHACLSLLLAEGSLKEQFLNTGCLHFSVLWPFFTVVVYHGDLRYNQKGRGNLTFCDIRGSESQNPKHKFTAIFARKRQKTSH